MYISKANRKLINDFRKEGVTISDSEIIKIIKKTEKKADEFKINNDLEDILNNDPLGIL